MTSLNDTDFYLEGVLLSNVSETFNESLFLLSSVNFVRKEGFQLIEKWLVNYGVKIRGN